MKEREEEGVFGGERKREGERARKLNGKVQMRREKCMEDYTSEGTNDCRAVEK